MQLSLLGSSRTVKRSKRVARGNGSGKGTTAGRGTKGQLSRGRGKVPAQFEGGQTSFIQRLPKTKGFNRVMKVYAEPINLDLLEKMYKDGETVSIETLHAKKILRNSMKSAKVLAKGTLTKKLIVELPISEGAKAAIEKAGGSVKDMTVKKQEGKTQKRIR